jgi:hypothetical protein
MEIIGRLLMMFILMGLASGAGVVCAGLVYLLLRKEKTRRIEASLLAGLFPPVVMGYLLACLVASSIFSTWLWTPDILFGDINEPLPNGFYLRALDKMPEAGRIERENDAIAGVAWVSDLQVAGPLVLGKYDYTYFPKSEKEKSRNLFLFDTRSGIIEDFANESDLAAAANARVHLTPTPKFRGERRLYQRIPSFLLLLIGVIPPFVVAALLIRRIRHVFRIPMALEES